MRVGSETRRRRGARELGRWLRRLECWSIGRRPDLTVDASRSTGSDGRWVEFDQFEADRRGDGRLQAMATVAEGLTPAHSPPLSPHLLHFLVANERKEKWGDMKLYVSEILHFLLSCERQPNAETGSFNSHLQQFLPLAEQSLQSKQPPIETRQFAYGRPLAAKPTLLDSWHQSCCRVASRH
ncbi:hypothetical protein M6B38_339620 [Iris pallida]|uniref:Uncharacterized protein n=1 Tax=Iris pallida TaxID=29817 RepID=A0AAX6GXT1_IRIPA|nr:hypothetical protein M6B38_339620 [Iris pallida]